MLLIFHMNVRSIFVLMYCVQCYIMSHNVLFFYCVAVYKSHLLVLCANGVTQVECTANPRFASTVKLEVTNNNQDFTSDGVLYTYLGMCKYAS